jgi:uncharacterized Ntn-hydrolase superfamily protein
VTFSIVAADPLAGDWGVAVASRFPCVGAVVPWARAGVGAVATQSWANTALGPDGLGLMGEGVSANDALRRLLEEDEGREDRQVGFVDSAGRSATFTGSTCMGWAGGATGSGFAAQGNILVGEPVVAELARVYSATEGDLCDRLLAALLAGDAAGGDRRGRQSAALLVVREGGGYEGRNDRYIDLRVDDHPEAPRELARLLAVLGNYAGEPSGVYDDPARRALGEWAGEHNLEGRLREDDQISNLLVVEIRDVTPELPTP